MREKSVPFRREPSVASSSAEDSVPNPSGSRRLHRKRAADYLGMSLSWLDKSRLKGTGPAFITLGGRVIYDTHDLDQCLKKNRRRSTSDQ